MSFTIGSLFDGSGGFPLAAFMCGGIPVWASEVEPYPIAVTKTRFPNMKHLGSVTDVKGGEIEPVDVITFGSPCQDLSVAGRRAGLKHTDNGDDETTRSGLFMEAVRIIKEMRDATNGNYPRFALWENVPGAFSSNKGEDFRIVLEELIKIIEPAAVMPDVPKNGWPYEDCYSGDGWSLAYRVLDAQFWGVPQRRRRIYLVLDLGGQRAREISFKRDSLRGIFEEGRAPWQATPRDAKNCFGTADCERTDSVTAYGWSLGFRPENTKVYEETATTLCNVTRPGFTCGVIQPIAYGISPYHSNCMKSNNPHSGIYVADTARTLDAMNCGYPGCNQGGIDIVEPICVATQQGGAEIMENKSPTITASAGMSGNNQPCVCVTPTTEVKILENKYLFENHGQDARYKGPLDVCPMLPAQLGTGGNNTPFVVEQCVFRKGTRPHSVDEAQKWEEAEVANTVNTFDVGETRSNELVVETAVYESHPMDSRIRELDNVSPTVSVKWHKGAADTPLVVEGTPDIVCCIDGDKIGKAEREGGSGLGIRTGDKMYTLAAKDAGNHAVAYCIGNGQVNQPLMEEKVGALNCMHDQQAVVLDRAFYNQGANAQYEPQLYEDGTCPTLVAKGPAAVCTRYIVRRLTPTECARLQGFPDRWATPEKKDSFTDEEYQFWLNVRNAHAEINGKATKNYTKDQMLNWYNKLHTDSAEYKLWGNGIALPCAVYFMQGISEVFE